MRIIDDSATLKRISGIESTKEAINLILGEDLSRSKKALAYFLAEVYQMHPGFVMQMLAEITLRSNKLFKISLIYQYLVERLLELSEEDYYDLLTESKRIWNETRDELNNES